MTFDLELMYKACFIMDDDKVIKSRTSTNMGNELALELKTLFSKYGFNVTSLAAISTHKKVETRDIFKDFELEVSLKNNVLYVSEENSTGVCSDIKNKKEVTDIILNYLENYIGDKKVFKKI